MASEPPAEIPARRDPLAPTILDFGPFTNDVEGLSACRIKTRAVHTAVQKYIYETLGQPQMGLVPTSLPTLSHKADFNFMWDFHPNFDLAVMVPIVTNHFESVGVSTFFVKAGSNPLGLPRRRSEQTSGDFGRTAGTSWTAQ